jgi:hypothetical protein
MAYIYDLADVWASSGTTFTGIKLSVTDTASAAGSLLMDLQVGGVSQFRVSKAGTATLAGGVTFADGSSIANTSIGLIQNRITVASTSTYAFSSTAGAFGTPDVILARDAANTLAQRNGVNAQAFNIYNTHTDASNYERGFMRWSSNVLQIGSDKLGTGTARGLEFHTNGINRMQIQSDGSVKVMSAYFYNHPPSGGSIGIWAATTTPYIGNESNHPLGFRTNNIERLALDTVGSVRVSTALTVATLPASPLVGMMARVTNAVAPTVGSTVTGGGAANALCWYNGTNWTVIGV